MSAKEYLPLEPLGGVVIWPDVVVCAPRWSGRGIATEEREYLPVVRCAECKHACEIAGGGLACTFRSQMMHETKPLAYCSDGERASE